jgi:valyl-tRNA synthetase
MLPVIMKLGNLSDVSLVDSKQEGAASFMIGTIEYYIPLAGSLNIGMKLSD